MNIAVGLWYIAVVLNALHENAQRGRLIIARGPAILFVRIRKCRLC